MNTRAKTAGKPAKAAQNVASTTATTTPAQNGTAAPATTVAAALDAQQPETRPIASRSTTSGRELMTFDPMEPNT